MNFLKGLGLGLVLVAAATFVQSIADTTGRGYAWNPLWVPGFFVVVVLCWIGVELSSISTQLRLNGEKDEAKP